MRLPIRLATTLSVIALSTTLAGCDRGTKDAGAAAKNDEPVAAKDEPAVDEPAADEPAADEPAADEPKLALPGAKAKVGAPAPDFTLTDLEGNEVSLSSFAGKTVVLEWFNPGCPFVKFAHGDGPLASMGNDKMGDDLVWLAINSGAPGKQGHGIETNAAAAKTWAMEYPVLLDESGEVGKAYGALKTPHVFVIDPDGVLRYRGALDNAPIGETQNEDYANFLETALTQLAAGQTLDPSETAPYGCGVKYGS